MKFNHIQKWTNEEILLLDREDYQYKVKSVKLLEMMLVDSSDFSGRELDFIDNYGWNQYNIKFNNALIDELNFMSNHDPEFFKFIFIKIN